MTITVKYFASLRESLGRNEDVIDSSAIATIADVWMQVSGDKEPPANLLSAVNMEYADFTQAVRDGDEIAFFPPVTGG